MRPRALQATAGAIALIGSLYTSVLCCNAFVIRAAVPERGGISRIRRGVAGLQAAWIDEQVGATICVAMVKVK